LITALENQNLIICFHGQYSKLQKVWTDLVCAFLAWNQFLFRETWSFCEALQFSFTCHSFIQTRTVSYKTSHKANVRDSKLNVKSCCYDRKQIFLNAGRYFDRVFRSLDVNVEEKQMNYSDTLIELLKMFTNVKYFTKFLNW